MKKDNDIINESSINDLIRYSENEEKNNTPEKTDFSDDLNKTGYTKEKKSAKRVKDNIDNDYVHYRKDSGGTKKGVIVGIIIGLIVVIIFISVDSELSGKYKNNFLSNFSNILRNFKQDEDALIPMPTPGIQYRTEIAGNTIISMEKANEMKFVPYKDGILCANTNYMSYIDMTGKIVWKEETAIVNPILKAAGSYILLAENGRSKICLYNDRKLVYETDDPDTILAAKLSSNGDVVIVTDKASYKGGISVYNKTGAQIFSWASGSDTVISADISSSSRRVGVALLNTDTYAKSVIHLFNVNETDSYAKIDVDNTVVFDVEFTGDTLNVTGDNRIIGVSAAGKLLYDNTFENVQLIHSAIDEKGNKILSFDDGNTPLISVYSGKGKLKNSVALTGEIDLIDINKKNALFNIGRDIYFGKLNSKYMTKYTATMDIRNLYIISDNSFVIVYSNSIEVITI
ncbi:MAG: hypothetical protein J1F01_05300 [Oscillospiraceae bacterium]|nr:hypothetical protein [Oscillospiraceae bacterium]